MSVFIPASVSGVDVENRMLVDGKWVAGHHLGHRPDWEDRKACDGTVDRKSPARSAATAKHLMVVMGGGGGYPDEREE